MTSHHPWRQRLRTLRERLRADAAPRRGIFARWLPIAVVSLAVTAVAAGDAWLYTCGFEGCPSPAAIQAFRPTEGSRVFDRAGRVAGQLTFVRRTNVPLSRVPPVVRQAFIATEDRRFYEHAGLDWRSALRAAVRNVAARGVREGFSTITMQVARNAFTPGLARERSIRRKLLELRLARLLERNLTKDQILQLYFNIIYLGNGTYGVEAASRDLFGKSVDRLTLAEAATLAALPKAPSAYTPRRYPRRARARRDLVLALMAREGFISAARARRAASLPLRLASEAGRPERIGSSPVDLVRSVVDSVLGPDYLDEQDVRVYTTLDLRAQRAAERAVARQAAAMDRVGGASGRDGVQGALVALDPRTGAIRALVGGRRYERGGYDRALRSRRQPGSAFKPFVYAAALGAGIAPSALVDDVPVEVQQPDGQVWSPANYGDEYDGRITLRRALIRSANAATVRVSRAVGEARVVAAARRNGIESPLSPVPSIALGAFEVTPLELVAAYAPFANGGLRVRPWLVTRIETTDGTVLWRAPVSAPVRVLDARDAYQLTSMLEAVVDYGTGRAVRALGAAGPIAGKTGTTNEGTDVWFVGYTPDLVAGIWFGYDTPRSIGPGASGGRYAAPAWAEFYRRGWHAAPDSLWRAPAGMVQRVIDPSTGELATEWCPTSQAEWFEPGLEPTRECRSHIAPDDVDWDERFGGAIADAFRRLFKF